MKMVSIAVMLVGIVLGTILGATLLTKGEGPSELIVLDGSFPRTYDSLSDLSAAADLIVVGSVRSKSTLVESPHPQLSLLRTVYSIEIREVVKGSLSESVVPVIQTGGQDGRTIQEFREDPLFVDDEDYVLFLKYAPETERYFTVGAHAGRFVLDTGQVSSLSTEYPSRDIEDMGIRQMPIEEFRQSTR